MPHLNPLSSHETKTTRIATQLRERTSTQPLSLRKTAVSHMVPKAFDKKYKDEKIDISDLSAILEIDPEKKFCVAEPGVTFVDLVKATLPLGLVPMTVPEFKTITIGGAVAGCSIESMSFQYGGFHDSCFEYEVITADGRVLTCTPDNEHSLIFQMMHGTFGTLGIISKLKFRLVPAKPFVKVIYEKYSHVESYELAIRRHFKTRDVDFMDGFVHSPTLYVLNLGVFVDQAPYQNRYDWMKIYYQTTATRDEDYLRTPDYFFRYDRGVTGVRFSSFFGRLFFGKFASSSHILRLAEKIHWLLPRKRPTVTLDIFVSISKIKTFLKWYEHEFQHFPLWVVPYKRTRDYEWANKSFYEAAGSDELFVDLAIYGMKQRGDKNYYRIMEEKLMEIGGIKTLISHNFYSEEEFWKNWNKPNYDQVKAITDPKGMFRDLYQKTCR